MTSARKRLFSEKMKPFAQWPEALVASPRHCEPRSGAAIQKRAAEAPTGRPA
jgi:hypothetical protein